MGFVAFVLPLVSVLGTVPAPAVAAPSPPSVFDESVSGITEHDATLEASINPNGLETSYRFLLESGCLPPLACMWITSYPLPSGKIAASREAHKVTLDLNSAGVTLQPHTEYRYSLEAASSAGSTEGPGHFFTTSPASAPSISGESVSNITPTDATLEAQINTEGLESTYEVWVGALPCIEEAGPERCEEDKIVGSIPASFSAQQVSVDIANASRELKPNTSYLYSVRATNMDGTSYGANEEFKTAVASPPSIERESLSHLTSTDATLAAQINTEGLESTYNFFLQEAPLCFKATPPCERPQHEPVRLPSGNLLGSFVVQSVSVELNSAGVNLSPGEHYEYWVTATSAAGTASGQAQEFSAPEDGVQPVNTTGTSGSQSAAGSPLDPTQDVLTPLASNPAPTGTPPPKVTGLASGRKLAKPVRSCRREPKRQTRRGRAKCAKRYRKGRTSNTN